MRSLFSNYFYIDTRGLKAFRVSLSLVVIYDMIVRATDLVADYTNEGVLPLKILFDHYWNKWNWSLATSLDGNYYIVLAVFIIVLSAAFMLLLGYRVRLMTIICWIGIVSIQNRNPVIYQGGDDLLRMLLFWAIFLPLTPNAHSAKVNNVATMAILCQVLFTFLFSGLFKGPHEWWYEGSAIYYALSLDQIARPAGLWMAKHYQLTVFVTRVVYIAELLVFPLFLLPFYRERIRMIIFIFLIGFNTGIILTMMIGIFPLCFLASSVLFIPSTLWDKVDSVSLFKKWTTGSYFFKLKPAHSKIIPFNLDIAKQSILGFFFALVILWNVSILPLSPLLFPSSLDPVMYSLRLNQSWGMFAPTVLKQDGWIIARAELANGEEVDLNADDLQLNFNKPDYVLSRFKNDRWRKYTEQVFAAGNEFLRLYYAKYLMHHWNRCASLKYNEIKKLTIYFMLEMSRPVNEKMAVEKVVLFESDAGYLAMHDDQ